MFRRHGSGRTPESHALAGDRGAVTLEAAITFGTLVAVAGLLAGGIAATVDHLRCVDAAGEAARLWARGDETHAHEAVGRIAPAGATLTVDDDAPASPSASTPRRPAECCPASTCPPTPTPFPNPASKAR
ncbi:TadE family type IV pilus minor pilin [Saccharomonospora sp. CUA-673]|uniref:TadE family type IV pilus minor pilin n=1 Tax=Saccharomonospora sp. CUA-673 TaxID=1904969 RepID=UPI003513794A